MAKLQNDTSLACRGSFLTRLVAPDPSSFRVCSDPDLYTIRFGVDAFTCPRTCAVLYPHQNWQGLADSGRNYLGAFRRASRITRAMNRAAKTISAIPYGRYPKCRHSPIHGFRQYIVSLVKSPFRFRQSVRNQNKYQPTPTRTAPTINAHRWRNVNALTV